MNILIKLMSIVSLVIAPSLALIGNHGMENSVGQNMQIEKNNPSETNLLGSNETKTFNNASYNAFIGALEEDGFFDEATSSIVVSDGHIKVDGRLIDQAVEGKYLAFLNGEKDVDLHFDPKKD